MTKIDIISGFLGAGKTTLIKKLLDEVFQGEKVVLIENEFGEIGIDSGFLKDSGIEISEMNSGCICCSLVGDFGKNLREVLTRFHPDRILIEPSGVGKLSDVIKSVKELVEEQEVKLNGLITVVNTLKAKKQMKGFGEFFNNQIVHANTIVLSRTQKMEQGQVEEVVKEIRKKNETASIITTPWEELTGSQMIKAIEEKSFDEALLEETKHHHGKHRGCGGHHHEHDHHHGDDCGCKGNKKGHHHQGHGEDCTCGCHNHNHEQDHHHAEEIFTSWGVETPHLFTKNQIENAMKVFCDTKEYGTVLRAKGMVPVESKENNWIYFDMVDGEYELRNGAPDYTGKICVIGSELKEDKLQILFGLEG